jgi:hypothetical protein
MGATNYISKAFWKSVYTHHEGHEKLPTVPYGFRTAGCYYYAALEKHLNTAAREFK